MSVHALYLASNIFIGPVLNSDGVSVIACSVGCCLLFSKAMVEDEKKSERERKAGWRAHRVYIEPLALNEAALPAISSWRTINCWPKKIPSHVGLCGASSDLAP